MAVMGRKPIPSKVQKTKGVYKVHPERENKREPKPSEGQPIKDKRLVGRKIATAKWKQLVKWENDMRLNSEVDSDVLVRYALTWQMQMEFLDDIDEHGSRIEGASGAFKANPAVAAYFQTQTTLDKLSAQLGIGASNRASLKANPKEEEKDPFIEFMERQKTMVN
jgi:P27 family predicted phage terminase small subunit